MGRLDQQFPSPEKIFGDYNLPQDQRVMEILRDPFAGGMGGYSNNTPGAPQSGFGVNQVGSAARGINNGLKLYNFLNPGADAAIAGLGGASAGLSGMGAGSLAGTVGGADVLGSLAGGSGFLPSYAAAGGAQGAGIFGSGAAGSAAGGAGGASGAGAGAGASSLGAMAGVALPAAVLLGGLTQMFRPGTQPVDISSQWLNNINAVKAANNGQVSTEDFGNLRGSLPGLDGLLQFSLKNGVFDRDTYNQALSRSKVTGKHFEGEALRQGQLFGDFLEQNPHLATVAASGPGGWYDQLVASYGGG